MYSPVFELETFDRMPVAMRKTLVQAAVEFLIAVNRLYIRKFGAPPMYSAGLKYSFKVRPFGLDSWQDIPRCLSLGTGDCKDFTAWRVAELREAGASDAQPRIMASEANGLVVYHVQVMRDTPKGPIVEDPSSIFGMPPSISEAQAKSLVVGPQGGGVDGIAHAMGHGGGGGFIALSQPALSPLRGRGLMQGIPWYMMPRR